MHPIHLHSPEGEHTGGGGGLGGAGGGGVGAVAPLIQLLSKLNVDERVFAAFASVAGLANAPAGFLAKVAAEVNVAASTPRSILPPLAAVTTSPPRLPVAERASVPLDTSVLVEAPTIWTVPEVIHAAAPIAELAAKVAPNVPPGKSPPATVAMRPTPIVNFEAPCTNFFWFWVIVKSGA